MNKIKKQEPSKMRDFQFEIRNISSICQRCTFD